MNNARKMGKSGMAALAIVALLLGGFVGYDMASGGNLVKNNPVVVHAITFVIMGLTFAFSLVWWSAIDEAQREAHKWAWYWGGSCGLLVAVPAFVFSHIYGDAFVQPLLQAVGYENRAFEGGLVVGLFPPVIGYVIAWGIWWLRHR